MKNNLSNKLPISALYDSFSGFIQKELPVFTNDYLICSKNDNLSNIIGIKETYNYPISDIAEIDDIEGNVKIKLYENSLQFIWNFSFSIQAFYRSFSILDNNSIIDDKNLTVAFEVFELGMKLFKRFNIQDFYNLPNPLHFKGKKESIFISNAIFRNALSFILLHEFSHYYLNHHIYCNNPKQEELQADSQAIDFFLENKCGQFSDYNKMGIIAGMTSLLFFNNNLQGGTEHPDPDLRIENILSLMKITEFDETWNFASIILLLWLGKNNYQDTLPNIPEFKNKKDLFQKILYQLQKIK